MPQSNERLPEALTRQFQQLVEQAFSDDLHVNGGDWRDSHECTAEHWEELLDIMRQEITDRTLDHIESQQADEPHPSLSAAERNPRLR